MGRAATARSILFLLAALAALFARDPLAQESGEACSATVMREARAPGGGALVAEIRRLACAGDPRAVYRVTVRRRGLARDVAVTVFESIVFPAPTGLRFVDQRRLEIRSVEPPAMEPEIYPVTIDLRSLAPDRVWRLRDGVVVDD